MSDGAKDTISTVIPAMRYRNAPAAIEWLVQAFGFEKHLVVPGPDETIAHAQLSFGNGMIMLGSSRGDDVDPMFTQPADIGGTETQCPYIIVEDADTHCERARAAGAVIEMDVADQEHGGRLYTCRDLEGHIWNFGTYDPWQATDD